ncbi:hypothetical protein EV421DRAFT_1742341 [Armillaria borealis]|uniref:Uncharacterized protein n=1 Tax=Armillaria borealis TaxID=47425 RepID=A0AA39IZ51_9AGAR|nr:hypothetical protein EV421DRAFT_1742341 [Armillaria borealis]
MPKASTKLAEPDGTEEIVRSDATKRYKVKPVDLDTLRPVHTERGEKTALVKYYNTGDVEALEQRLKQGPSLSKKTVKKTGGKISAEMDFGDASQKSPSLPGTSKGKTKEDSDDKIIESLRRAKNKGKSPVKQNDDVVSESIKKAPSSKRNDDSDDYDYDILEEDCGTVRTVIDPDGPYAPIRTSSGKNLEVDEWMDHKTRAVYCLRTEREYDARRNGDACTIW